VPRAFLTARNREFRPVAGRILAELEALVRERVGDKRLAELKAALAELLALD
jgi:hypothetical protein